MEWYLAVLKKYATFSGRARRKEFWMFALFNFIIALVFSILSTIINQSSGAAAGSSNIFSVISGLYSLAVLIPGLAVAVRRLHDTGRSGWNYFLGLIPLVGAIILIVYFCQDSQAGENQYGPNPKEAPSGAVIQ
jgi:uncharacterized membrane protein YhaH (DUF805 family)